MLRETASPTMSVGFAKSRIATKELRRTKGNSMKVKGALQCYGHFQINRFLGGFGSQNTPSLIGKGSVGFSN